MSKSLLLRACCGALLLFACTLLLTGGTFAQTTAFTYQGRLTDGGSPANGSYDLEFKLFNQLSGGTLQGSPQTLSNVTVTNGIFTVQLDFGSNVFTTNAGKFLEIGVRNAGGPTFTTLPQRQPVNATPYAIQSISATSATNFTGSLSGDVTGTQAATVVSQVGGQTAANVASGASAANAATNANTPNTIVKRDASGNFSAGTITAALSGNASTATTAGNVTGTVAIANGGTGATTAPNARTSLGLGSLATVTPTGTASTTTFLRGDNSWAAVGGGLTLDLVATKSMAQTLPTATSLNPPIIVKFETTVTAPSLAGAMFDGETYTVGQTGFYLIHANFLQNSTTVAGVFPALLVNGTPTIYGVGSINGNAPPGTFGRGQLTALLNLTAGDTVRISAVQNQTTATATLSADGTTRITILKF